MTIVVRVRALIVCDAARKAAHVARFNGRFRRSRPRPLVQIAGLSNVDRNPTAILGLFGINVIAGQRLERRINRVNLVLIAFAGLAGPS